MIQNNTEENNMFSENKNITVCFENLPIENTIKM